MLVVALLSVLVGLALGMLGGGGSILMLPILLFARGLEEQSAIATSLLVVGVTSLAAMLTHARLGNVVWRMGLTFAAAGALGAFLGGLGSEWVPARWLIGGFLLMMVGTGVAMLRGRGDATPTGTRPMPVLLLTGFVLGAATGLVGAGGGFVVVPALVLVGGLPMQRAVGTSLLIIAVQTLSGFVGHALHAVIDVPTTAMVMAAAVVGAAAGGQLSARVPAASLRRAFGNFVLAMAAFMAWERL